jgi:hypothetical protein
MKNWNIPTIEKDILYPHELLQKYADSLIKETKGVLAGQVTEKIENDFGNNARIVYALYIYLAKLKQSYRLFEIEQIESDVYPVNLKVFYYTGSTEYPNLDSNALEERLDLLIASAPIGNLISHFLRMSELKE